MAGAIGRAQQHSLQHFESGVLIDSWTHTYATRVDAPASKLVIGQSLAETGYSELEVAAVLLYDRALSTDERQQVEAYLANKYTAGGISNQPPTANDDDYSLIVGGVINTTLDNLPSVLDNDTDPNFDPLEAFLVTGPTHAHFRWLWTALLSTHTTAKVALMTASLTSPTTPWWVATRRP